VGVHLRDAVGFVPMKEISEQATFNASEAFRADSGFADADLYESSCSSDDEVQEFERKLYERVAVSRSNGYNSSSVPDSVDGSEASVTSVSRGSAAAAGAPQNQYARRRRIDHCFLCSHTNRTYDAVYAKDVHQCIELLEKGIGHSDYKFLARQVHLYFKHHIYIPMRRAGKRIHIWRSRSILEHIMLHEQEPRIFLSRRIKSLSTVLDTMDNMLYYVHPETGKRVPHHANMKAWCDQQKLLMQFYKLDATSLNFYDPSAGYDPGARVKNVFEGQTTAVSVVDRHSTQVYKRRKR